MLHRGSNAQVFGEEHRRFRNRKWCDLGAHQSDTAGSGIGEHFSVGQRGDVLRERHDVVVGWHVLHRQVLSAVAHENVALVLDEIGVSTVVECSEFFDVAVAHVHAFHQRVAAHDAGVQRGQEVDGLLKLVPNTAVPFGPTHLVEDLLVWGVH